MKKICLCPSSIAWIVRHLRKDSKAAFRKMIKGDSILAIRNKRKTKRRFSAKQLAAQRLFAKRARAGTLRRRRNVNRRRR